MKEVKSKTTALIPVKRTVRIQTGPFVEGIVILSRYCDMLSIHTLDTSIYCSFSSVLTPKHVSNVKFGQHLFNQIKMKLSIYSSHFMIKGYFQSPVWSRDDDGSMKCTNLKSLYNMSDITKCTHIQSCKVCRNTEASHSTKQ